VEPDAGAAVLRLGVDPDLGDAAPDAVRLGLESRVHGRQPRGVGEELLVPGAGVGDGLEETNYVAESRGELRRID
jgi:hypothetical protein